MLFSLTHGLWNVLRSKHLRIFYISYVLLREYIHWSPWWCYSLDQPSIVSPGHCSPLPGLPALPLFLFTLFSAQQPGRYSKISDHITPPSCPHFTQGQSPCSIHRTPCIDSPLPLTSLTSHPSSHYSETMLVMLQLSLQFYYDLTH